MVSKLILILWSGGTEQLDQGFANKTLTTKMLWNLCLTKILRAESV